MYNRNNDSKVGYSEKLGWDKVNLAASDKVSKRKMGWGRGLRLLRYLSFFMRNISLQGNIF
jgi:hypothetical protein